MGGMSDHGSCIPHHINLKCTVNFQVALKQNRAKINCIKRDMLVLIRDKEGNIVSNKEKVL